MKSKAIARSKTPVKMVEKSKRKEIVSKAKDKLKKQECVETERVVEETQTEVDKEQEKKNKESAKIMPAQNKKKSTKEKTPTESVEAKTTTKNAQPTSKTNVSEPVISLVAAVPIKPDDKATGGGMEAEASTDYEDDVVDGLEMTSVTEQDTKHFISVVYDGPDEPPRITLPKIDFSELKMVVNIDEFEKHTWQVTENICLYTSAPQIPTTATTTKTSTSASSSMRTPCMLPKKRRVRVSKMDVGEEVVKQNASETKPSATSTPARQKTDEDNALEEAMQKAVESSPLSPTAKSIKIDDIDAILSHLHGT